jgi:hypothetical protein
MIVFGSSQVQKYFCQFKLNSKNSSQLEYINLKGGAFDVKCLTAFYFPLAVMGVCEKHPFSLEC